MPEGFKEIQNPRPGTWDTPTAPVEHPPFRGEWKTDAGTLGLAAAALGIVKGKGKILEDLSGKPTEKITGALKESQSPVSEQPVGRLEQQKGSSSVRDMAAIAAMSGGAAVGAYMNPEHRIMGGIEGALAGGILSRLSIKGMVDKFKEVSSAGDHVGSIDELMKSTAGERFAGERAAYQVAANVERAVPDVARRDAIFRHLDGDTSIKLTPVEAKAAADVREFYGRMGEYAKEQGVIKEVIDNYATRIYGKEARSLIDGKRIGENRSLESPFGKQRTFPTLKEAEAAGFHPITTDISQVVEAYSKSIVNAIENKRVIKVLKEGQLEEGVPFIAKEKDAPANYVAIDHPQLRGLRVNPDIAGDLKFYFDQHEFGPMLTALDTINSLEKRGAVMASLFHMTALTHALLGAMPMLKSPIIATKAWGQALLPSVFGESLALKMIREGGAGDMVDFAGRSGLKFGFERGAPPVEEMQGAFYRGMESTSAFLDNMVPGLGKLSAGNVIKLNHAFDKVMWGRFHPTLKLAVFSNNVAQLTRNNARAAAAGKTELLPKEKIGEMAASHANDLFGGLDWQGLTREFSSKWGRAIASSIFGPSGRAGMRLSLFAPDWGISTTRSFIKAFGGRGAVAFAGAAVGSDLTQDSAVGLALGAIAGYGIGKASGLGKLSSGGIEGLLRPRELADLHRQYLMRSAFIYTAITSAINYKLSGHFFWDPEQKDPTRIDLGNGQTMQASKHFMEPFHWLLDPRKQALNKLSFIVKEPLSQAMDVEYLSPHGAPRMGKTPKGEPISMQTRIEHATKGMVPIAAQQGIEGGALRGLSGFMGYPIYGKEYMTPENAKTLTDIRQLNRERLAKDKEHQAKVKEARDRKARREKNPEWIQRELDRAMGLDVEKWQDEGP
jgi:hypothetical protein